MSITNIYGIAGTALNAQITRMHATASNLANAGTMSGTEAEAFRGKRAVFKALVSDEMTNAGSPYLGGSKSIAWSTIRLRHAVWPIPRTRWPTRTAMSTSPTSAK